MSDANPSKSSNGSIEAPAMGFPLSTRDRLRLQGVHPALVRLVEEAARTAPSGLNFTVVEGLRTPARQKELVKKGASTTLRSRHLNGHAVDIVPLVDIDSDGDFDVSWHWPHFRPLSAHLKNVAKQIGVPVEWGGDWRSFPDGPHWQLPWAEFPG